MGAVPGPAWATGQGNAATVMGNEAVRTPGLNRERFRERAHDILQKAIKVWGQLPGHFWALVNRCEMLCCWHSVGWEAVVLLLCAGLQVANNCIVDMCT